MTLVVYALREESSPSLLAQDISSMSYSISASAMLFGRWHPLRVESCAHIH